MLHVIQHMKCAMQDEVEIDVCCADQFSMTCGTDLIIMSPHYHYPLAQAVVLTKEWTVSDVSAHLSKKVHRKGVRKLGAGPVLVLIGAGIMETFPNTASRWQFGLLHERIIKAEKPVDRLSALISPELGWVCSYYRLFWGARDGECVRSEAVIPAHNERNILNKCSVIQKHLYNSTLNFLHLCVYSFYLFICCGKFSDLDRPALRVSLGRWYRTICLLLHVLSTTSIK